MAAWRLKFILVYWSVTVGDGLSLKLDATPADDARSLLSRRHEGLDEPEDAGEVLEKMEKGVKKSGKALEHALKPSKDTQKQWKGGYKSAKKGAKPDGVDTDDIPGLDSIKDDLKKPWKMPKEQRKLWMGTLHLKQKAVEQWKSAVASTFLWFMFTALFGFFYRESYASIDLKFESTYTSEDWSTGICACETWMARPSIFCMSFWCPAVRWSQTVAMTQISDFWQAFFCFNIANLLAVIPLVGTPFAAALDTYDRMLLREKLGMPTASHTVCIRDCCCFMCCTTCMIAQEAYHVEDLIDS